MREHTKVTQRGNDRILVVYCSICGKEGIELALEPECVPLNISKPLDKKPEPK